MSQLSISAAIKQASRAVVVSSRQNSYIVSGPWDDQKIHGARTERHANSYYDARILRKLWVVQLALVLMGFDGNEVECDLLLGFGKRGSARDIVAAWVALKARAATILADAAAVQSRLSACP